MAPGSGPRELLHRGGSRRCVWVDAKANPTVDIHMTEANTSQLNDLWMGRSSRSEYWFWVVAWTGVYTVLFVIFHGATAISWISLVVWLYVSARRLHDFNASALWGWGVFVLGFALGIAERTGLPVGNLAISAHLSRTIIAVATLGMILLVGSVPGSRGENRFGSRTPRKKRAPSVGTD
jgi:uncharacterized membrane protein YhaH (DUF805 family)